MKGVSDSQSAPLEIVALSVVLEPTPVDSAFLLSVLPKLDWPILLSAVSCLSSNLLSVFSAHSLDVPVLPTLLPASFDQLTPEQLGHVHTLLMDVHVLEGKLICPATKRAFDIKDGIPNMLLLEDEL